jgi:hypothetical protein
MLPPNAPDVQCGYGATLRRLESDHSMRCSAQAAQTTLRHDILTGILRCGVQRAGIASTLEPALCRLPGLTNVPGTPADGFPSCPVARGDILLAMTQGICIADHAFPGQQKRIPGQAGCAHGQSRRIIKALA